MFDSITAQLNPRQAEAVVQRGAPLLVLAGAGSGKTRVLACRVAHLIESGVAPNRILLLTFTRRAAREMIARARSFTDRASAGRVWGGTFHSVANRLLRRYGNAVGLTPDFTVIDSSDSADLMRLVAQELGVVSERRFPKKETLASIYSRTVNNGTALDEVVDKYFPWCKPELDGIRDVCAAYTSRKREHGVLDLDDMLLYWAAALAAPAVGDSISGLFDHVLVDEYQDTNSTQADIVAGLVKKSRNVTVVGDDFQAIYAFRAATVRNLFEFTERFPEAKVVTLDQNYRSTSPILAVANSVMKDAREGFQKQLWSERPGRERPRLVTCSDEDSQSDAVCRRVLELRDEGTPLREQAVLFRAASHSNRLELELARRNIPFVKYGGLVFLERAHVKDTMAMLRVLVNPQDELAWFRVFSLLEGVGPATARKSIEWLHTPAASGGDISPLRKLVDDPPAVPKAAAEGMEALQKSAMAALETDAPAEQVERIGEFLEKVFVRRYDDAPARIADVTQLARMAEEYTELSRFLTEVTLDPPMATQDLAKPPHLDDDWLVLSTIHSAKGQEWEAVHVISAADGAIPSDMAADQEGIEEERRLFYVAITRAKRWLSIYFPLKWYYRRGGQDDLHHYAQLTRFLPDSMRDLFDHEAAGEEPGEDPSRLGLEGKASDSVDRLLQSLFSKTGS
ncbi:MAG TPA: ATP-dependent helicase [Actinomycetota bacterium]|nr:ATP-dependent helicase [Actinomycetota bacterium]